MWGGEGDTNKREQACVLNYFHFFLLFMASSLKAVAAWGITWACMVASWPHSCPNPCFLGPDFWIQARNSGRGPSRGAAPPQEGRRPLRRGRRQILGSRFLRAEPNFGTRPEKDDMYPQKKSAPGGLSRPQDPSRWLRATISSPGRCRGARDADLEADL